MSREPRILRWMCALSQRLRQQRRKKFLRSFVISSDTKLLDVGGSDDWDWGDWPAGAPSVTMLNLDPPANPKPGIQYVQADACDMSMFADQSFDIVFSNSVIEHVTEWKRQQAMAAEIRRVGKSYWVQTPNRHFPIEPHMLFPFFQYLPLSWRRVIGRHWPFSFEKLRKGDPERDAVGVRLLTRRELQQCFPDGEIHAERFLGLVKSWVVVRGAQRQSSE